MILLLSIKFIDNDILYDIVIYYVNYLVYNLLRYSKCYLYENFYQEYLFCFDNIE